VSGRLVALLVGDRTPKRWVSTWRTAADAVGAEIVVVGPRFGVLDGGVAVDRSVHITDPVEYDGVVLAAPADAGLATFVQEAYRHHKTVALLEPGTPDELGIDPGAEGVTDDAGAFFEALTLHRHWER
jgi:hypothetical protein